MLWNSSVRPLQLEGPIAGAVAARVEAKTAGEDGRGLESVGVGLDRLEARRPAPVNAEHKRLAPSVGQPVFAHAVLLVKTPLVNPVAPA